MTYFDPLTTRYASDEMAGVFSEERRLQLERALWLVALHEQSTTTVHTAEGEATTTPAYPVTDEDLQAYKSTFDQVTPWKVAQRERRTRHATRAHLEVWNELAGRQKLHLGMTSSDVTETVAWLQFRLAAQIAGIKWHSIGWKLLQLAERYRSLPCVGRTHNRPAQATTFGRRIAHWAEQAIDAFHQLRRETDGLLNRWPAGAVGTAADTLVYVAPSWYPGASPEPQQGAGATELPHIIEIIHELHQRGLHEAIGHEACHNMNSDVAPSQVHSRVYDSAARQAARAIGMVAAEVAVNLRLLAGLGHVAEGRGPGQIGSSAMPHKNNPRYCEQVHSLNVVLRGFLAMADESGLETWYEGDVSHSAARRVWMPGMWLALDGICNTLWHVLSNLEVDEAAIRDEYLRLAYDLTSGQRVAEWTKLGLGHEEAHARVAAGDDPPTRSEDEAHPFGLAEVQVDMLSAVTRSHLAEPNPAHQIDWRIPA